MEISVLTRSEVQVIQLRGALRLGDGVDKFRQAVDAALSSGNVRLVVHLSEVPMVDSSGIGVLVKSMASVKQRGGAIKLVNPSKFALQTLRLVGVLSLFEIFENEDQAVASFA